MSIFTNVKRLARKGMLFGVVAAMVMAVGVMTPSAYADLDMSHTDQTSHSTIKTGSYTSGGDGLEVEHKDKTSHSKIKTSGNHDNKDDRDDDDDDDDDHKSKKPIVCTDLKVTKDKRAVHVSAIFQSSVTAKIVSATYDFDDDDDDQAGAKASVIVNARSSASHVYVHAGTHNVKAVINLDVAGKPVTTVCQKPVTIPAEPATPATPAVVTTPAPAPPAAPAAAPAAAPSELLKTGAGGIAALFATVAGGSTLAYRHFLSRRFN